MTRRESREHIFKMLFCRDFYAAEEWKEQAERYLDSLKRMGKVDITVLRLALYEMGYDEDVPVKVAINEAVEIARKFGGDESPGFVNGILARLVD